MQKKKLISFYNLCFEREVTFVLYLCRFVLQELLLRPFTFKFAITSFTCQWKLYMQKKHPVSELHLFVYRNITSRISMM